ncbi:chromosome segregation protein SMC [Streptococcus himalayensis]|nr:chromosome segregation protein SMC [Streptococcus himalayensis]
MFLKEIEIQGFKSFADKTKVVFDRGVTAVVGPNGSGKSNITESLRWALGESSVKSLRGGKMPDVIFAGTENRKPLNYAAVTVVLDNQDQFIKEAAKEIRVERHIYRNGDSEYKIDGKKVRLRDIHDLFMDTGLGRDSFSIISQGRVEEIFNSKPEERRAIFEEAAGVLKYKTRRKETESKLAQTQDNLDRLEDIIYELDAQIQPLEKQAKTAQRFLELDERRKALYLDVLIAQIRAYKQQEQAVDKELLRLQEDLSQYYQKREQLEMENQALKAERHRLQAQMTENQATLLELTRLISDLKGQIDLAQLETSQAATNRKELEERLQILREKEKQAEQERQEKEEHLSRIREQVKAVQQNLETVEADLATFSEHPDQLIEQLREKFVALLQEEADVSNSLTALSSQIEHDLKESEHKKGEWQRLKEAVAKAETAERQATEELESATQAVKSLLEDYRKQLQLLEERKQQYQAAQQAMFDQMDQLKSRQARFNSLEAIQKNHSNFYAGVKAVLQEKAQLGGIIGAVSEHLTFDWRYQTALEIAMGASSQHIIVEDEGAATRAIDFLKKHRSGRATFLPLTTIKPRTLVDHQEMKIRGSQGFLGLASELVTFDERLTSIFHNLLGTTAIFDTIEHAKQAAVQVRYQVRMVTLDGTELRTGGSYAGGANRNQQTLFIKPEMDALKLEIQQIQTALSEKEQEVESLHTLVTQASHLLEEIKTGGEEARLEEQKARLAYEQAGQQLEELTTLLHLQEKELTSQQHDEEANQKVKLEQRLEEIQAEKGELESSIHQVKSNKSAVEERLSALQHQLSAIRLEKAELLSQERYEQTDLARLKAEVTAHQADIEQLVMAVTVTDQESKERTIPLLTEQLETAMTKEATLKQTKVRLDLELEDLEGQLEDLSSRFEQIRQQNDQLIRAQAKSEAEKEKIIEQLRRLHGRLTEEYQESFAAAAEKAHALENLEQAEQEVKDLERQIRTLGPVNLEAIAQFEEVHSRLTFLNTQKADVLSAKTLLVETIEEMNEEVKERFQATFEAIRESFKVTFQQMFGGGRADLLLTDTDLLQAGVEISVQPPGKKIQSLNLMSGGEKALSALALLFSIIRIKTIPFVILDEVEAALDEANVKRFGDYLNRFDKESQFIVVTHRKGTMAAADSIYGVTMQESGVSKIVSVKLKDLESM